MFLEEKPFESGLSEQGWIFIVSFICFLFIIAIFAMKAGRREVLQAFVLDPLDYDMKTIENPKMNKRSTIGAVRHKDFLLDEGVWVFWLRHFGKTRRFKSKLSLDELEKNHCNGTTYKIYFPLNAAVFKRSLKENEYYDAELGWEIQALFLKGILFFFSNSTGVSGVIFLAIIFYGLSGEFVYFLVGLISGMVVLTVLTLLQKYQIIPESAFKKKIIKIKEELRLVSLNAEYEIIDIYIAYGTKRELITDSDESFDIINKRLKHTASLSEILKHHKTLESKIRKILRMQKLYLLKYLRKDIPKNLLDLNKKNLLKMCSELKVQNENGGTFLMDDMRKAIVQKHIEMNKSIASEKKREKLEKYRQILSKLNKHLESSGKPLWSIKRLAMEKIDEDGKPLMIDGKPLELDGVIVKGYQALYEMRKSENYSITSFKLIDQIEHKRSNQEMQMLTRDYFSANRSLCEDNLNLLAQNKGFLKQIRDLEVEKVQLYSQIAAEVSEMGIRTAKEFNETFSDLPAIFTAIYGKRRINAELPDLHHSVIKTLDKKKNGNGKVYTAEEVKQMMEEYSKSTQKTIEKEKIEQLLKRREMITKSE